MLLYLQEHSKVRAPKLYAAFINPTNDLCYMVMEFIEGDTLDMDKWLALDDEAQTIICSKLSEQLKLLRSIPCEGEGYYGRVYRQGWSPLSFLRIRYKEMLGPYNTFDDFISAMYVCTEHDLATQNLADEFFPEEVEFLSKFKHVLGKTRGFKPVLTFLDLKWDNLIVRPIKGEDGEAIKDWEITLIDWHDCGWLPAFMQFAALEARIMLFGEDDAKFRQRVYANFEEAYTYTEELKFLEDGRYHANYTFI